MSRKARESAATKTLLARVESRSTGRLSVGARAAEVSVWLLQGQIVAATSPTDERSVLRLARIAGAIEPARARKIEETLEGGGSVFGDLLDAVRPEVAERLLADRFRANLVEFLGSMSRPSYTELSSVFVDNLQMGHDTPALVASCAALADVGGALDLDAPLVAGTVAPEDAFATQLRERLGSGPRSVGTLLATLPWEPALARAWIHDALERRIVAVHTESPESADDWSEDDATEHDAQPKVLVAPISQAPEPVEDPPTPDTAGVDPASTTLLGLATEDSGESTADAPSPMAPEQIASVRSWLSKAHSVEEDELDFFEDHDSARRGGSEDGSFSTGQHNLDKVEVNMGAEEGGAEAPLEADEAPATRYSAPTIDEDEASAKVEVINGVLQTICQAFDQADGPGRGRSAFQLLIEGSPPKYQAIFDSVQVSEEGSLPPADVVANLLARPATEQRLLLTQALNDLVDRALSAAADELPDEVVDALLEHTAGYRGRLGL